MTKHENLERRGKWRENFTKLLHLHPTTLQSIDSQKQLLLMELNAPNEKPASSPPRRRRRRHHHRGRQKIDLPFSGGG